MNPDIKRATLGAAFDPLEVDLGPNWRQLHIRPRSDTPTVYWAFAAGRLPEGAEESSSSSSSGDGEGVVEDSHGTIGPGETYDTGVQVAAGRYLYLCGDTAGAAVEIVIWR